MNRFQDEWMENEILKDWLVKVSNDEARAYCRFCAIVLRAHKTDLSTHSTCQKHIANAKIAADTGAPTAPISVQIVCNDNEEDQSGSSTDIERKPDMKHKRSSAVGHGKRKTSTIYRKKYRVEWESEPELEDWLASYPKDESKAFCKRCGVLLRAHKHDLLLHSRSVRHKSCGGSNISIIDIERMRQDIDEVISTADGTFNDVTKRSKPEVSDDVMDSDDHVENIVGFEINDSNDDKGGETDTRTSVVRDIKRTVLPVRAKYCPPKKRAKFNAADVVAAIENNEFTGYELLQFVKICVPKL